MDLIGYDGKTLAFVEVRTRTVKEDAAALPELSVSREKQRVVVRPAQRFLAERHVEECPVRFDVVAIDNHPGKPPGGAPPQGRFQQRGWIHATAHTADLLAALAKNKLFTKQDQERVLKAITQRLATANEIFSYGEQDRLANAAAAIASREDFDSDGWSLWVVQMDREDRVVWNESPPKMQILARFENDSYFLSAMAAQISLRPASRASAEAQKSVLAVLRHR